MLATVIRLLFMRWTGSDLHFPKARTEASTAPNVEASQRALEEQFEYAMARRWSLGLGYFDNDDRTVVAVGKPGWVPVQVLMLWLAGDSQLSAEINAVFFMGRMCPDDPQVRHWFDRNADCFLLAHQRLARGDDVARSQVLPEGAEQNSYSGLTSHEAIDAYVDAWVKVHARAGSIYLASSDRRAAFHRSPVMAEFARAARSLAEHSDRWAMDWLGEHGFELERAEQLVKLEGYQPLFLKLNVGY